MEKQEVYLIEIYMKNKEFEARASIPDGGWLEGVVNATTIHGLAARAAERWKLCNGEVDYVTIDRPEFNPVSDTSRDPITGQQMKDFHYWYMENSE